MENSDHYSENPSRRIFKLPVVVPISSIILVTLYVSYTFCCLVDEEMGILYYLKHISFEIFLLCQIGIISAIFRNKQLLDDFLAKYPVIKGRIAIEELKPVIRTVMYSKIVQLIILALASIAAIISIFHHELAHSLTVIVLSIGSGRLIHWYKASEAAIIKMECSHKSLKPELDYILTCWLHKPVPDF